LRYRGRIASDDLKRIGDPFFQSGKTYQRRHEGPRPLLSS